MENNGWIRLGLINGCGRYVFSKPVRWRRMNAEKVNVMIGDVKVKASREVRIGETVKVRMAPIERHYLVKQVADKRMSAQVAAAFVEDVTPSEQLALLNAAKAYGFEYRERGSGRPTKRDRRMLDKWKEEEC